MTHEEKRNYNREVFWNTQSILKSGFYYKDGKQVHLQLSPERMRACEVYLPEDIDAIRQKTDFPHEKSGRRCAYGCFDKDSFELAIERMKSGKHRSLKNILVLNLANPVNPGGGVQKGSKAQEEDLCRRSSLSESLFSEKAQRYYDYNRSLNTYMGSDAIIITPEVEVFKNGKNELMDRTETVAVMTCAAPMLKLGIEGMTEQQYRDMILHRIDGMLIVAAYLGYRELVLGAFGCGAFGNDARIVSDLFDQAFRTFEYDGLKENDCFDRVDFAVLDQGGYNYQQFSRNFKNFYREEKEEEREKRLRKHSRREQYLDTVRGCLVGGAAGDALGYAVEFLSENSIFHRYGKDGITEYDLDQSSGKAVISDDTQMTLFTANGLLFWETRWSMCGNGARPRNYVEAAYLDWLSTQEMSFQEFAGLPRENFASGISWLLDVSELFERRAPGNTCLSALEAAKKSSYLEDDYIRHPRNKSKGCGGVMRVAPVALRLQPSIKLPLRKVDWEAAQIAAVTHGHPLGYMPAAALNHIISRIVFPDGERMPLREIVLEARDETRRLFERFEHTDELVGLIDLAVQLSENGEDDISNIHRLGEGWVAEETLAIAIYCALRYQDDFAKGVIAAVNHKGDSDSTGAVTGNILGAWSGLSGIGEKWTKDLELYDTILEISDDLTFGCEMSENNAYRDPAWTSKYVEGRAYKKPVKTVFFWKIDEPNGCFSNWYPSPFVLDDERFANVEQYMMAKKAKLFDDDATLQTIMNTESPADCKRLGRRVKGFDSLRWDAEKYGILMTGNLEKFRQNPDLGKKLMDTGEAVLAEASPKDRIWGIGMDADEAGTTDPKDWPGQNLLGMVLMEVRDMLRKENRQ